MKVNEIINEIGGTAGMLTSLKNKLGKGNSQATKNSSAAIMAGPGTELLMKLLKVYYKDQQNKQGTDSPKLDDTQLGFRIGKMVKSIGGVRINDKNYAGHVEIEAQVSQIIKHIQNDPKNFLNNIKGNIVEIFKIVLLNAGPTDAASGLVGINKRETQKVNIITHNNGDTQNMYVGIKDADEYYQVLQKNDNEFEIDLNQRPYNEARMRGIAKDENTKENQILTCTGKNFSTFRFKLQEREQ